MSSTNTAAIQQYTEQVAVLAQEIEAVLPSVRASYPTLEAATRLMRRLGAPSIVDAMRQEAQQRVLRNRWAEITSRGAQ